jgi:hypothetical protein
VPAAAAGGGSFTSSEALLNGAWAASVATANDMVAPGPLHHDVLGRPCAMELKVVILDGRERDRCPWIGDLAVTGKTLLLAGSSARPALRDAIAWFATHQHDGGAIPASPLAGGDVVLFDYNAFWVEALYDYVLATGDVALARQVWPQLVRLVDTWYRARTGPGGLLVNDLGLLDYASIPRTGTTVAYYNAGYVRALRMAAKLAVWVGEPARAAAWRARVAPVAAVFQGAFWDAKVGAFRDATVGPVVHPEDGNAFAVLAGLAPGRRAASALDYVQSALWRPYGAAIADNDVWDDAQRWGTGASQRVIPFMAYFEAAARFSVGLDDSALNVIRRTWGYMLANGPRTTMWETIGPYGSAPVDRQKPSWDHGWSSGAAPALTRFVVGVSPSSPGYGSFAVAPHVTGVGWARGDVPTPHGTIHVEWTRKGAGLSLEVVAPVPATLTLPIGGRTLLDGTRVPTQAKTTTVKVGRGTHTLVVTP